MIRLQRQYIGINNNEEAQWTTIFRVFYIKDELELIKNKLFGWSKDQISSLKRATVLKLLNEL